VIKTAFLADYPDTIPVLAEWFLAQWPEYYAPRTPMDIAPDFYAEANRHGLPIRLVAFQDGELAGTITLREKTLRDLPAYRPGLGGLLVGALYRRQGIGTELVRAGMYLAKDQGYARVYAATVAARSILERLGWKLVQTVRHNEECLGLYSCKLEFFRSNR
jgi:RimJ/RimL family protein N-acetyltransferase